MRVAVIQFNPKLGDVEKNIERTLLFIRDAIKDKVDICLFPELSLTGYNLQDLTFEIALKRDDERLIPLLEASRNLGIVVGLIEEDENNLFYNSAFYFKGGKLLHAHRKIYLPTYGMFDEGRFVAAGEDVRTFKTEAGKSVMLICEDLWHFSNLYLAFLQGTKLIFSLSSSPGRGYKEEGMFGNAEVWMNLGEFYSRMMGAYFFYSNRVGVEDGFVFSGRSFIADPFGNIVSVASNFEEEMLVVDVDETLIRSSRISLPLLRDEKPYIVLKNLRRIINEREAD